MVRPYTIRDSVYNPCNRLPPVNQGILLERCSRDIRSRTLHAAQAQKVPAALGVPPTSTSVVNVTGSSVSVKPAEPSCSAPRSVVVEDKNVTASSNERKGQAENEGTTSATQSLKSESSKSNLTVVSY